MVRPIAIVSKNQAPKKTPLLFHTLKITTDEREREREREKAGRGEPARAACGDLDSAAAALVESVLRVLRLRGVTSCQGCGTKPRKAAVIAGAELAVKAMVLMALFMSRAHGLRPL